MDSVKMIEAADDYHHALLALSCAYIARHGVIPDSKILSDFTTLIGNLADKKKNMLELLQKETPNADRGSDQNLGRD